MGGGGHRSHHIDEMVPTALGPIIFLSVESVLYIDHLYLCYLLWIIDSLFYHTENKLSFILKCICNMRNMKGKNVRKQSHEIRGECWSRSYNGDLTFLLFLLSLFLIFRSFILCACLGYLTPCSLTMPLFSSV